MSELEKREKTAVQHTGAEQMGQTGPAFSPDVDIYGSDDELVFVVDVPGVGKGDVDIQIDENNTLFIKARNSHQEPQGALMRQYNVGDYYRAFQIGEEYDKEKIRASLDNGLLKLHIPKREEAKPRRIQISA